MDTRGIIEVPLKLAQPAAKQSRVPSMASKIQTHREIRHATRCIPLYYSRQLGHLTYNTCATPVRLKNVPFNKLIPRRVLPCRSSGRSTICKVDVKPRNIGNKYLLYERSPYFENLNQSLPTFFYKTYLGKG